jgi:hypothetical protein
MVHLKSNAPPKPPRHDEVAHERQQNLAALLVLVNLFVGAICLAIILEVGWDPEFTRTEWTYCLALVLFSWLNLLIAAGAVGWLISLLFSILPDSVGGARQRPDAGLLSRHRMIFYYLGVWSNLLALGLVIEITGGLAESPFDALLIAFVLTGQQLSRFRTQSGLLYISGLLVFGVILALEPVASKPVEAAPHVLTIAVAFLALVAGGFLNYFEKPHNYLVEKHVKQPSHARLYQDGQGTWRVALLENTHRQDPVLFRQRTGGASSNGEFPVGLKEKFQTFMDSMAQDASWGSLRSDWPANCTRSFVVTLVPAESEPS